MPGGRRPGGTTMAYARNVKTMEQKNIVKTCKGDTSTKFAGVTLRTIVYRGKTYYARSYTPVVVLPCKM